MDGVLLGKIVLGEYDADLDRIANAITERRKVLDRKTRLALKVGDRVMFSSRVKPRYMHGMTGTVTGFLDKRIQVELDHPLGRFRGTLRCPVSILEKVRAQVEA